MHSLAGKVALITGGTSGIGLAVAKNFADNGATVVITGRRDSGDRVAEAIDADFFRCDATDEQQVAECFSAVAQKHGKIDILVVNAGTADDEGSIEEFPTEGMKRLVDLNLGGVFIGLKYGPRHMNDGGSIITTGSVAGGTRVVAAASAHPVPA